MFTEFFDKYIKAHDIFSSSLEILDEMRPIRMIEQANQKAMITAYVGAQLDICEAFGISVPAGCVPTYKLIENKIKGRA
ncbi:MAG: hypothetical protein LBU04_04600 [Christensenellaceae bacterium]|nr:hypothetical protein [Christensenellaceae bacterium]